MLEKVVDANEIEESKSGSKKNYEPKGKSSATDLQGCAERLTEAAIQSFNLRSFMFEFSIELIDLFNITGLFSFLFNYLDIFLAGFFERCQSWSIAGQVNWIEDSAPEHTK